jgi:hypothetical protein
MYTLAIDHGRASHVTSHPDRAGGRSGLFTYLDAEGLDYQIAQAAPDRVSYTLTASADDLEPPRVVGVAILERTTGTSRR